MTTSQTPNAPVLNLRGVDTAFGAQKVLRGIDLDVQRGEILTVLGASGCGKSVLLEIVIARMPLDRGGIGARIASLRDRRHVTSVIVTHDLALAFDISDRLAFL